MMSKRILLLVVIVLNSVMGFSQLNINLVGQLTFPGHGELSDIWGHVDGLGNEYALVGTEDGTSIVDISTPSAPVEVFFSPGPTTIWRDLKVWNNHVYITNESNGGLKIIDMSNLPGAITGADVYQFSGPTYPFVSAHDLYIDENGIAYIMGTQDNGGNPLGTVMLDLNVSATNPPELGSYTDYYLHDGMVRGDTLWGGAINDGFFTVVDVSNKAAPITMQTQNTPNTFTHNCWISDDGQTLFTTDEVSGAFIGSFDVSDLSNITELDRVQSSPGQGVIVHNTFVRGNYLVTSYYRDGITIHDISNPGNLIEVGNYDTSPAFVGNGFNGAWGVYPYLPSGLIIASDIENGLFVLGPTYTPASYLVGNVIDSVTTFALSGVQVDILLTAATTSSNILGDYQTGLATPGTYSVTYSKFGYETKTITGVALTSGNTTTVNVELKPLVSFTFLGQVIEAATSNPIANANVKIWSPLYTTTVMTDGGGNFTIPNFIEGFYDVYVGKWGYIKLCSMNQNLALGGNTHVYQMADGYYDDFTFDLGWTETSTANAGDWEKGIPIGTSPGGGIAANPGNDVGNDCGDEAYVTGNGGGNVWSDDIDGGEVILTSPVFDLSSYIDPYVNFSRWFYNAAGGGAPNDSLIITLTNGITTAVIDFADVNDPGVSSWVAKSEQILSYMALTNNMQLSARSMDISPGNWVEAGFDRFEIVEMGMVSVEENLDNPTLYIYPNPFKSELNIKLNKSYNTVKVEVYEITGKKIESLEFANTSLVQFKNSYKKGIYIVNVYGDQDLIQTKKVIKF